jgi:hypothetical protein
VCSQGTGRGEVKNTNGGTESCMSNMLETNYRNGKVNLMSGKPRYGAFSWQMKCIPRLVAFRQWTMTRALVRGVFWAERLFELPDGRGNNLGKCRCCRPRLLRQPKQNHPIVQNCFGTSYKQMRKQKVTVGRPITSSICLFMIVYVVGGTGELSYPWSST